MHTLVTPRPQQRLARLLLVIAALLALTAVSVTVLEQVHVVPAEAGVFDCVAGLLASGFTFISMAVDPPAGIAAIFGWGAGAVGSALSVKSCQTGSLKSMIAAAYARHGDPYGVIFRGYICTTPFRCSGSYKSLAGSSGSW